MLKYAHCILLALWLVGCSSSSNPSKEIVAKDDNLSDEEMISTEVLKDLGNPEEEKATSPQIASVEKVEEVQEIEDNDDQDDERDDEKDDEQESSLVLTKSNINEKEGEYKVQGQDTLMLIAFKVFGDYGRWKELAKNNPKAYGKNYQLKAGSIIKYHPPASKFEWNHKGSPYLIVHGDTLAKISTKVYSVPKYWKSIWENNKQMIKNPNLIFAGFTIYYQPKNTLLSMY